MIDLRKLDDEQRALAQQHAGLCFAFARRYGPCFRYLHLDEILSAAFDGMMRAAADSGECKDMSKFCDFAWGRMRNSLAQVRRVYMRRRREQQCDPEIMAIAIPEPDRSVDHPDFDSMRKRMSEALERMTPRKREIVQMRLAGLDGPAIAASVNSSASYVSLVLREELGKIGVLPRRLPQLPYKRAPPTILPGQKFGMVAGEILWLASQGVSEPKIIEALGCDYSYVRRVIRNAHKRSTNESTLRDQESFGISPDVRQDPQQEGDPFSPPAARTGT